MRTATPRKLSLALLTAALLLSSPTGHAKTETTPLAVDASFNAAVAAQSGFTIADSKALKGMQRVAVPVFAVEFILADNVNAQTSGFGAAGRASSSLYYRLLGVAEPEFQAITNQLYAQFLDELKASGLAVVEASQVLASPSYSKLMASGSPAPIKSDTTIMTSPLGLGIYGFARMGNGNSSGGRSMLGALSDVGAGFAAVGAIGDTVALASELDASLIEVRMRVNFVQLSDDNKGFFGRMAGSAKASGKAFPSVDNVMAAVQTGPLRSTLILKHSLSLDTAAFAEVREKAATAGDVAGGVALGLLRAAIGSKDSHSSKELEVLADPLRYKDVVGAGLGSATRMLVARLKAER
jgi:hypothetical protein